MSLGSQDRVLGPRSAWLGLAGRVAAGQGMSSAATLFFEVVPLSKPHRQHEVSDVILVRLHATLQATSDTWQRCRTPRRAHAKPQSNRRVVAVGRILERAREGCVQIIGNISDRRSEGGFPARGKGAEKCECNAVGKLKIPRRRAWWWPWCSMGGVVLTSLGRDLSVAACCCGQSIALQMPSRAVHVAGTLDSIRR